MILIATGRLRAVRLGSLALLGALVALLGAGGYLATLALRLPALLWPTRLLPAWLIATATVRRGLADRRAGRRASTLHHGLHLALAKHVDDVELGVLLDDHAHLRVVTGFVAVAE